MLLSIGIPTYNRSASLALALEQIYKEQSDFSEFEVIVTDNNSTDNTREIASKYTTYSNFRYFKNDTNIGAPRNILRSLNHAKGIYCWILGDDDLIYPGALSTILTALRTHSASCFFINYTYESVEEKELIIHNPNYKTKSHRLLVDKIEKDGMLSFSDLIMNYEYPALFTSIVNCVFNRQKWLEYSLPLDSQIKTIETFHTLEITFPHSIVWAKAFFNEDIYFLKQPLVYFFVGGQEWFGKWETMVFTHVLQYSLFLKECGAPPQVASWYRDNVFRFYKKHFYRYLLRAEDTFRDRVFSLPYFLDQYSVGEAFWRMMSYNFPITRLRVPQVKLIFLFMLKRKSTNLLFYRYFLLGVVRRVLKLK